MEVPSAAPRPTSMECIAATQKATFQMRKSPLLTYHNQEHRFELQRSYNPDDEFDSCTMSVDHDTQPACLYVLMDC